MDSGQGSAQTKQAKKSKKWPKVLLAVVLVASLAGNAFLVFEKLNVNQGGANASGSICGDEIIEKYNAAYEKNSDEFEFSVSEVESKPNYKKDPNCIAIHVITKKYKGEDFTDSYKILKQNVLNNNNPSLKINGLASLNILEMDVKNE